MCKASAQQWRSRWETCMGPLLLLLFLWCGTSVISSLTRHKHGKRAQTPESEQRLLDEESDAMSW